MSVPDIGSALAQGVFSFDRSPTYDGVQTTFLHATNGRMTRVHHQTLPVQEIGRKASAHK